MPESRAGRQARFLSRFRPAFALRDAVTAVATAGVLLALAAAGSSGTRAAALLSQCVNNQREISAGSAAFALANQDLFAGFTWQQGNQTSLYADLRAQAQTSHVNAHAAQAVDFWRRRGRGDLPPLSGWFPDELYATVPLVEFLGKGLTDPFNVCPSDGYRMAWRLNPQGFDQGLFLPFQPSPSHTNRRWPYSSSYVFTAGGIDPLQTDFTPTNAQLRLSHSTGVHNSFPISNSNTYGPSPTSMVMHPSLKVFAFDYASRHGAGDPTYFALSTPPLPAAFFDGSVRLVHPKQAKRPWNARNPDNPALVETYAYTPATWEPTGGMPPGTPPPPTGSVIVDDPFRFTRDGLLGWDFPAMSRAVRGNATPQRGLP